jgi:tetratricopeptide (TPR) repeat protein
MRPVKGLHPLMTFLPSGWSRAHARQRGSHAFACARVALLALVLILLAAAGAPACAAVRKTAAAAARQPPADLRDLDAWLAYQDRAHITALPAEARIFYRRALTAWKSGESSEAVRLTRGAIELDPSYAAPQLKLTTWLLLREPSQAVLGLTALYDLVRRDFLLQHGIAANAVFFLLYALFFAVLAAAALLVALRHQELLHMWEERFGTRLTAVTTRWWAWIYLLLPMVLGLGLAFPTLLFLGMLWPLLRVRERLLFITLVILVAAAPLAPVLMGRLAAPLRADGPPFFGVAAMQNEPATMEQRQRLAALAARHPSNPFVHFGLGWSARRGGDLGTAEAAYRKALERWPDNDRVLVDLGNVLAAKGSFDQALALYQRAIEVAPNNAAAHFNASQVHNRRFDYQAANQEVTRASELDFELVRAFQAETPAPGELPLADQWLPPVTFWRALLDRTASGIGAPAIPPAWRGLLELSVWWFSVTGFLLAVTGVLLGIHWQRRLPVRACSNCGRVVCRRCAERRREMALCPSCTMVAARAASPEFARVLLLQHARRVERSRRLVTTSLATLIPGSGQIAFHRVFGAVSLLASCILIAFPWLGVAPPFTSDQQLAMPADGNPWVALAALGFLYLTSLMSYLRRAARADAARAAAAVPVRSRVAQATRLEREAA